MIRKALRLFIDHSSNIADKLKYQGANKLINKINKDSSIAENIYNKLSKFNND